VRTIRLHVGMSSPVGDRLVSPMNWRLNSSSSGSGVGLVIRSLRIVQFRWWVAWVSMVPGKSGSAGMGGAPRAARRRVRFKMVGR